MNFILPTIFIVFFIVLIWKLKFFRSTTLSPGLLSGIFLLKIIAGLILYYIYTYYYQDRKLGDTFRYFDDGYVMYKAYSANPSDFFKMLTGINSGEEHLKKYYFEMFNWYKPYDYEAYNDNRIVIRLNALLFFVSGGNYHVHSIIFNFLAFTGLTSIFRILHKAFSYKHVLCIPVYLTPSVLLWSSGVLKESILLFAFGIFLNYILKFIKDFKPIYLIMALLMLYILSLSKVYVVLAIIPSVISLILYRSIKRVKPFYVFFSVHILGIILLFSLKWISPPMDFVFEIIQKQKDFYNVAEMYHAQSVIQIPALEPTLISFIKAAPEALFNALFRPLWWDLKKPIILPNVIENTLILLFIIPLIFFGKKPDNEHKELFWTMVFFTLVLGCLIGLVTPVLGAIVRYKIPLMPFMLTAILMCIDLEKIKAKFPSLNKLLHE